MLLLSSPLKENQSSEAATKSASVKVFSFAVKRLWNTEHMEDILLV